MAAPANAITPPMPAAQIYTPMLGIPHTHVHPPSLVPPAPPCPLPSIGAGMAPFGLGADIGGSIRGPAFFNGVFGHKPSSGLVPNTGQWPIAENEALEYLSTGPLCRRADDLWPLLEILAGPDGECAACREMELGDPSSVDVAALRVLDVPSNRWIPVRVEVKN